MDDDGDGATGDFEAEAAEEREIVGVAEATEDAAPDREAAREAEALAEAGGALAPSEREIELDWEAAEEALAAFDAEGAPDFEMEPEGVFAGVLVAVEVEAATLPGMHWD